MNVRSQDVLVVAAAMFVFALWLIVRPAPSQAPVIDAGLPDAAAIEPSDEPDPVIVPAPTLSAVPAPAAEPRVIPDAGVPPVLVRDE